jgi:Flp pilus assembly pilin Flp
LPKQRYEILQARRGTTAVEYAIMAAVIAALLVGGVRNFGTGVSSIFAVATHIAAEG